MISGKEEGIGGERTFVLSISESVSLITLNCRRSLQTRRCAAKMVYASVRSKASSSSSESESSRRGGLGLFLGFAGV